MLRFPLKRSMATRFRICVMTALLLLTLYGGTACMARRVHLFSATELEYTSVTQITQDADRYLWIATEFGLLRFDGYHFRQYLHDPNDVHTLPSSFVTSIDFVDKQMIVTTTYGMARYNAAADNFERYRFPQSARPRVSGVAYWRGTLVAGTEGYGLLCQKAPGSLDMQPLRTNEGGMNFISALTTDDDGALWIADHSSLLRRLPSARNAKTERYDVSAYGQPVGMVSTQSGLLVVCRTAILRFDKKSRTLRLVVADKKLTFSCVRQTSEGKLLVGTMGNGVFSLQSLGNTTNLFPYNIGNDKTDTSKEDVRSIYEDRSGDLWIGCYRRGVFYINRQPSPFYIYDNGGGDIFTNIIPATMRSDGKATLYCQTRSSLRLFDSNAQPLNASLFALPSPLPNMEALYRDSHGRLWIGTDKSLYLYDAATRRCKLQDTFQADMINVIADSPDFGGDILFVSTYGKGLCVYDVKTGSKRQLDMNDTSRPSDRRLSNNWASSLCYVSPPSKGKANAGRLWIGTTHGLNIYDAVNDKFERHRWQETINDLDITSLCRLTDGDVSIGTNCGVYRYHSKGDSLSRLSPRGTPLDMATITGQTTDLDGNLWIASSCGVWMLDKSNQSFTAYRKAGDVPLNVFNNYRSIVRLGDGNIAVAIDNRIVTFSPRLLLTHRAAGGKLTLTQVEVSGRSVSPANHIEISHNEGTVRLEFSLMDYANAEATTYRYRINHGQWIDNVPGDNTVTINQILPGDIRIEVMAGIDGTFCKPQSYTVTVLPPWYLTWWAKTLMVIVAIATVATVTLAIRDRRRLKLLLLHAQTLREKFSEALHKAYKVDDGTVEGDDEKFMERVKASVNDHFKDSDYSVDDMAADVGVSRAVVGRKIKQLTGVSPSTFVRNLRLEQAKQLLAERKLNITQVAYECGFSSGPVFSKIFRKHFGLSPRSFLEQIDK